MITGISKGALFQGNWMDLAPMLPTGMAHCCVTSPPYFGLRDYGHQPTAWTAMEYAPMPGMPAVVVPAMDCCLGLEPTPEAFVGHMVLVFREVRRVLRDDGTLWLNLGDSYYNYRPGNYSDNRAHAFGGARTDDKKRGMPDAPSSCKRGVVLPGLKQKDLIGIPWRVAFALQADGWYLRQDIIWSKPNPMPESVKDRCTKAHEYIFLLSKQERYYYDAEAVKEPSITNDMRRPYGSKGAKELDGRPDEQWKGGTQRDAADGETRNRRSVWTVTPKPFKGAHFATFPPDLIEPCILAGCPVGGVVLEPFCGSGTVPMVAEANNRTWFASELTPKYCDLIKARLT